MKTNDLGVQNSTVEAKGRFEGTDSLESLTTFSDSVEIETLAKCIECNIFDLAVNNAINAALVAISAASAATAASTLACVAGKSILACNAARLAAASAIAAAENARRNITQARAALRACEATCPIN